VKPAVVYRGRGLPPHGFHDRWIAVTEEQRAVASEIVHVAVSVDVPFAGAIGAVDEDGMREQVAGVVRDAAGEDPARLGVAGLRGWSLANIRFGDLGGSGCFHME